MHDVQILIEKMYNKYQTKSVIHRELEDCIPLQEALTKTLKVAQDMYTAFDLPFLTKIYIDIISIMSKVSILPIRGLIGSLLKYEDIEVITNLIKIAIDTDLLDATINTNSVVVSSRLELSEDTINLINQYMYLPPMVVPPKKLKKNRDTPHLTLKPSSLILKDNHHEDDICLDHLNRMNSIPLTLNVDVIRGVEDLPPVRRKTDTDEDWNKKVKGFVKFTKETMQVYATMVNTGNEFYLPHKYAFMGRTFCQGYHLSYQSNDYRKAVVELANKELIPME